MSVQSRLSITTSTVFAFRVSLCTLRQLNVNRAHALRNTWPGNEAIRDRERTVARWLHTSDYEGGVEIVGIKPRLQRTNLVVTTACTCVRVLRRAPALACITPQLFRPSTLCNSRTDFRL